MSGATSLSTALEGLHSVTVADVEQFFVAEAALLDEWKLNEWLDMLTEDARYLVPSPSAPEGNHRETMFLISDDIKTLRSRATQLLRKAAWAENPRSRTRRLVTNFRILEINNSELRVTANFAVWRFQFDQTDTFVGRYVNVLVRTPSGLRIRERRAVLDHESLRPHGKLSFIL